MRHSRLCGAVLLAAVTAWATVAWAADGAATQRSRPHQGAEPDRVFFIIYVLDIDDISGRDQNFTVNLFLRLRWKDERLAHDGTVARTMPLEEVWNPRVIVANQQSRLRTPLPQVAEVEPDGTVIYRQQYVGPLSQPFSLRDFPLDTQDFTIQFVAAGYGTDEIEFVPEVIPGPEQITGGWLAKELSLPDWYVLSYEAKAEPFEITGNLRAAGFVLEFTARRYFAYYLWQAIVPLVLIVMMSWSPFWINPEKAEMQLSLASATVLTLIAYRFLLASLVPKLPYLTRLDYMSVGGTVLVFLAFLQVLLTSMLASRGRVRLAKRMDSWCRALFPAAFAALIALAIFF